MNPVKWISLKWIQTASNGLRGWLERRRAKPDSVNREGGA